MGNLVREGFAKYVFSNKFFSYEGEWKNGKKHGHGKFIMRDGSVYEGSFTNDEIQGIGHYYDARAKSTYEGEFVLGEKCGKGLMQYYDGSFYEGEWHSNKKQGQGTLHDVSGNIYEGEFYQNKKHGEGTERKSDGSKYTGYWVAGFQHGHGNCSFTDGSSYEGQWRYGVRHGIGVFNHISGFRFEGLWHADIPTWMASKLCLTVALDMGKFDYKKEFTVFVECLDKKDKVCHLDNGRSIEVFAGRLFKDDNNEYSGPSRISSPKNEFVEFAKCSFDIEIIPIEIMAVTLTMQHKCEYPHDINSQDSISLAETGNATSERSESSFSRERHSMSECNSKKCKVDSNKQLSLEPSALEILNIFYTASRCVARTSNGRVTWDRLIISDESQGTSDTIAFIARDVTCPPFMGTNLEPCYVLLSIESNKEQD